MSAHRSASSQPARWSELHHVIEQALTAVVCSAAIAFSPQGELWAVSGAILGGQPKFLLSASRVAGGAAEPVALSQGVLDTLLGAGHDDASAAEAVKAAAGAARVSSALRKRKYDSQDVVRFACQRSNLRRRSRAIRLGLLLTLVSFPGGS